MGFAYNLRMSRHKYVKLRQLSLDVENDEYIYLLGIILVDLPWSVLKLQRGASDVHRSYEAKKRKKHDQIRDKVLFSRPCDNKLICWSNELSSSIVERFWFKHYNISLLICV